MRVSLLDGKNGRHTHPTSKVLLSTFPPSLSLSLSVSSSLSRRQGIGSIMVVVDWGYWSCARGSSFLQRARREDEVLFRVPPHLLDLFTECVVWGLLSAERSVEMYIHGVYVSFVCYRKGFYLHGSRWFCERCVSYGLMHPLRMCKKPRALHWVCLGGRSYVQKKTESYRGFLHDISLSDLGLAPGEVMKLFKKFGVFVLGRTHNTSLYGLPF